MWQVVEHSSLKGIFIEKVWVTDFLRTILWYHDLKLYYSVNRCRGAGEGFADFLA